MNKGTGKSPLDMLKDTDACSRRDLSKALKYVTGALEGARLAEFRAQMEKLLGEFDPKQQTEAAST